MDLISRSPRLWYGGGFQRAFIFSSVFRRGENEIKMNEKQEYRGALINPSPLNSKYLTTISKPSIKYIFTRLPKHIHGIKTG